MRRYILSHHCCFDPLFTTWSNLFLLEIHITLTTWETGKNAKMEKVLYIFQNIKDRELGRQQSPRGEQVPQTNAIHYHVRGLASTHRGTRQDYSTIEGWECQDCRTMNYAFWTACLDAVEQGVVNWGQGGQSRSNATNQQEHSGQKENK